MSTAAYEIHIKGRVSEQLLSAFEGMEASEQAVETVLRGPLPDQAALHGLLDRIQALGLELVEVRRVSAVRPCATKFAGRATLRD